MIKADGTVRAETKYILCFTAILSVLMQAVFLVLQRWDYTVLTGNILSYLLMNANFYFMCLSIQKALASGDKKDAEGIMKKSRTLRMALIVLVVVLGVTLPVFSVYAVIIPLFFTRIAVAFRPLWKGGTAEKEVPAEDEKTEPLV